MKNWMIKLEEKKGCETTKNVVALVAVGAVILTIIVGNYYLLF